jgi:hypothetical protein
VGIIGLHQCGGAHIFGGEKEFLPIGRALGRWYDCQTRLIIFQKTFGKLNFLSIFAAP